MAKRVLSLHCISIPLLSACYFLVLEWNLRTLKFACQEEGGDGARCGSHGRAGEEGETLSFLMTFLSFFKQNINKSEPKNFDFSPFSLELYFIVSHESHRIEAF